MGLYLPGFSREHNHLDAFRLKWDYWQFLWGSPGSLTVAMCTVETPGFRSCSVYKAGCPGSPNLMLKAQSYLENQRH